MVAVKSEKKILPTTSFVTTTPPLQLKCSSYISWLRRELRQSIHEWLRLRSLSGGGRYQWLVDSLPSCQQGCFGSSPWKGLNDIWEKSKCLQWYIMFFLFHIFSDILITFSTEEDDRIFLHLQDACFNCFSRFSVPKWRKTSSSQPELPFQNNFSVKALYWLCIFFILVVKMRRNS